MTDRPRSEILKENPIGKGLDIFRASFSSVCDDHNIPCSPDALDQLGREDIQNVTLDLLSALRNLPAVRFLRSNTGHGILRSDLLRLISAVTSDDFDFDRVKPLLHAALADNPADSIIWDHIYNTVAESTAPPRPIASSLQQTPWLYNTSSFANSSEYRMWTRSLGLETASEAVIRKCSEGSNPLFAGGWCGWPQGANQDDVLNCFADLSKRLAEFAEDYQATPTRRRRPLAQPNKLIHGSTGERKVDIGFVTDPEAGKDSHCHWSQILVPGELKSNPSADTAAKAWLDLGRYAPEAAGKVFPNGRRWKKLEPELYSSMKKILRDARKDPEVLADG
ncbi:hypothetical protein DL764_005961 [Monosporascus ibericus]|uniref:Fungal-type protein kinase domain-containing protein n=1 Tax=Monosporascus ibericus TaxID=155417 RepID=A0A4Q4T6U9_9PEZI|nr:hypothetical protein DL764_005961 [Monosporascus ibericus]